MTWFTASPTVFGTCRRLGAREDGGWMPQSGQRRGAGGTWHVLRTLLVSGMVAAVWRGRRPQDWSQAAGPADVSTYLGWIWDLRFLVPRPMIASSSASGILL